MLEAWRPLLFSDEDLEAKTTRDPVAPASRSEAARTKHSPGRSRTAARSTASAPCSSSSAVSSRTLPHPGRRSRCANLRGPHHAQPQAAERISSKPSAVGRVPQSPRRYLVETITILLDRSRLRLSMKEHHTCCPTISDVYKIVSINRQEILCTEIISIAEYMRARGDIARLSGGRHDSCCPKS